MRHLGIAMMVVGAVVGAAGLFIYFTERGVANEIKGFVLVLVAAVMFGGGCVLRELTAIRRALDERERKNSQTS